MLKNESGRRSNQSERTAVENRSCAGKQRVRRITARPYPCHLVEQHGPGHAERRLPIPNPDVTPDKKEEQLAMLPESSNIQGTPSVPWLQY